MLFSFQRNLEKGLTSIHQIPWTPYSHYVYQFRENYEPKELVSRVEKKRQQFIGDILGPEYGI